MGQGPTLGEHQSLRCNASVLNLHSQLVCVPAGGAPGVVSGVRVMARSHWSNSSSSSSSVGPPSAGMNENTAQLLTTTTLLVTLTNHITLEKGECALCRVYFM